MSKKLTLASMNAIVSTPISPVNFTHKAKDGADIVITIDPNISLSQTSSFVDSVAEAVFTEDGDYIPEYRDLATFIAVIRELSNMPLPTKDDTVDVMTCHKWMLATELLSKMSEDGQQAENSQLAEWFYDINSLITNKIEFKKQEIMAKHQSNYAYFEGKLEELINAYSELGEKFAALDPNEVMSAAQAMTSLDTEKVVGAIIDINEAKKKKPSKKPATKKED